MKRPSQKRRRARTRQIALPREDESPYTHLFASICEEQEGFVVQVRLFNDGRPNEAAWGEEVTDCLESAAGLLGQLAAEFAIPESRVTIEVRAHDIMNSTCH